ncbi:MAG: DUF3127 domain-containing protein [Lentisphaerae bacterium]|nr:DUF3127 domain-containing protein [Lentisphaerota bacterium]
MDAQEFKSGFTKREFVVTTEDDRYPQDIKFECVKDKCAMLDNIMPGQKVKVSFDLRGNEYKDRYYVNLNVWRIEKFDGAKKQMDDNDGPALEDLAEPAFEDDGETPF